MPIKILMPALSPTMTEGNLAKWLKKEGDKISPGEIIAEIETDKATMEVEAVDEGVLVKIVVPEGAQAVAVNQLIAVLAEEGEDHAVVVGSIDTGISGGANKPKIEHEAQKTKSVPIANDTPAKPYTAQAGRMFASPLAKRVAMEANIDLNAIKGSGPHGRIIKDDVIEAKKHGASGKVGSGVSMIQTSQLRVIEEYTKIPNNNMRKVIAKRLLESKQTIPHFYLSIECEMDRLLKVRAEMNAAVDKDNPAYKLSVNDFIIKASAMALQHVPSANASWSEEAILRYNNVDISVAVAIDGGLITPIIRNADIKSLSSISNEMKDLAARARAGKLAPEEFQGGSFSISNLGMYNIKKFSAIINPPQSCILAVGASNERAIVKNGQVTIANMVDITLSCDHRVVDGAVGAEFLAALKKFIENPLLMLV